MTEAESVSGKRALAIGNFDGVHRGHQALLGEVVHFARAHDLEPAVLTFDPHPTAIVAPDRVPPQICSPNERIRLLQAQGITYLACLVNWIQIGCPISLPKPVALAVTAGGAAAAMAPEPELDARKRRYPWGMGKVH